MKALLILLGLSSPSLLAQSTLVEPFFSPYNGVDRFFVDKVIPETQDGIRAIYSAEWYFEFPLKSESGEVSGAKSCAELYLKSSDNYGPKNDSEYAALIATKVFCQSWKVMGELKSSKATYLTDDIINEKLPNISPPELSFIISDEQAQKSKKVVRWADMDKITNFERLNDFQAVYYDDSDGYQKVTLMATGDYNGDGLEDVLLLKENSVLSGSYGSTHGYVLTRRSESAQLKVLVEW